MKNYLYLIAVAVLTVSPAFAIPAGLVHHWNFDEGPDWHDDAFGAVSTAQAVADPVGGADLDLQNMTGAAFQSGRQYTCLEFNGTDQYLSSTADLSSSLSGTFSVAFWVRTQQSGNTTLAQSPAVVGASAGAGSIYIGSIDSQGRMLIAVNGQKLAVTDDPVNDGHWHHLTFTRDSSTGQTQVYVDGAINDEATGAQGQVNVAVDSIVKTDDSSSPRYFQGRLDELYIYETVLDPATIGTLIDNHAPKVWPTKTNGINTASFSTESVLFKSYDPEKDDLRVVSFTQPDHGSATYNGDGTFTYTADAGYSGNDSFTVTIEDQKGGFSKGKMNLTIFEDPGPDASKRTTVFDDFQPLQAAGSDISHNGMRVPRAIDWEGDGDNDILVGHSRSVWLYINNGSPANANFAAGVRVKAGGSNIYLGSGNLPITLADMTGDGVLDLVAVDNTRKVAVFENTAAAGQTPSYSSVQYARKTDGSYLVLTDQRFDAGDWDNDGLTDIITGSWSGGMNLYKNVGTASDARYENYETVLSGSYNLYPRIFDINRNGMSDFIRGINWGSVLYWFDPELNGGLNTGGTMVFTDPTGASVNMKSATDGAIVDFADYNGDGVYDALIGGHYGDKVYIAWGQAKTVADYISDLEAIYDANLSDLGIALEANSQALLNEVRTALSGIVANMQSATVNERQQMFQQYSQHVQKYDFLQMDDPLNVSYYHHVPSIAGQNLMTMHYMLPDTPTHRQNVADAVGLTGVHREIYLMCSLHVGDNQKATRGQIESVRDFMTWHPQELFPDAVLTLDHYYNDGRGGMVAHFTSTKNTFNWGEGNDSAEWDWDLQQPVNQVLYNDACRGDYFTFVMGHEVTHSLDGYVNSRANKDMRRRWGQFLVQGGGPDVIAGSNDWIDWNATKQHFKDTGLWNESTQTWDEAWDAYWATGPGSAWNEQASMRINIKFFLSAPQESLATQANHHWAHSEGRLIGAIDRFRRAVENDLDPLKANINEAVTFLDFVSAGLNKVVMYDTHGVTTPYRHAEYTIDHAWLERNDKGYITKVSIADRIYEFELDAKGIITGVNTNIYTLGDDKKAIYHGVKNVIDVLRNDSKLEGGSPSTLQSCTQPAHGTAVVNDNGTITYMPDAGYYGSDSFTYKVKDSDMTAGVELVVASDQGALMETFKSIGGSAVSDLTGSSKYPYSPDEVAVMQSFEAPTDRLDSYGVRMRAFLKPTVTGSYTFWIASDDNGSLLFSTDGKADSAVEVASVPGWTSSRSWTDYPEQQSAYFWLTAGNTYYIEALMKEGGGGDNLAVAWQGPGISRQVITGSKLKPYTEADYTGPTPDPITWATAPHSVGPTTVTMTAADVNDADGVEYFFTCTTNGQYDSAWQDDTTYTLTGLTPETEYQFSVKARDKSLWQNETQSSQTVSAVTSIAGDVDLDSDVDFTDFSLFAQWWLSSDCGLCSYADLNADNRVEVDDLVLLTGNWMRIDN
ncbi:PA14 domain protein [Anaerohalosphaera lusitana]|uniref:PA14 domain protein n=1 Tax=Anaerohalosphaera lusitana TaxID=1936003 RepID=A0A1U9NNL6_9BACT|nr:Ig-like domain-containing protein [Anaerohalosphaera lusitana]AQT69425.1 PA14 domain protein [Anaerohalosphaera lusitana]